MAGEPEQLDASVETIVPLDLYRALRGLQVAHIAWYALPSIADIANYHARPDFALVAVAECPSDKVPFFFISAYCSLFGGMCLRWSRQPMIGCSVSKMR